MPKTIGTMNYWEVRDYRLDPPEDNYTCARCGEWGEDGSEVAGEYWCYSCSEEAVQGTEVDAAHLVLGDRVVDDDHLDFATVVRVLRLADTVIVSLDDGRTSLYRATDGVEVLDG